MIGNQIHQVHTNLSAMGDVVTSMNHNRGVGALNGDLAQRVAALEGRGATNAVR